MAELHLTYRCCFLTLIDLIESQLHRTFPTYLHVGGTTATSFTRRCLWRAFKHFIGSFQYVSYHKTLRMGHLPVRNTNPNSRGLCSSASENQTISSFDPGSDPRGSLRSQTWELSDTFGTVRPHSAVLERPPRPENWQVRT